jgi:hypothetical protein
VATSEVEMIFVFLGLALVFVELLALRGQVGELLLPSWSRVLIPLLVLGACWYRWPRDRIAWTLVTVGVLIVFNRNALPAGWLASIPVMGVGLGLTIYGWKTRKRARVERSRLGVLPLLIAWAVIALLILWVIPSLGR